MASAIIESLLARLSVGQRRNWKVISPDDVRAEMTQRREEIVSRHEGESADCRDREPLNIANPADIREWEQERDNLSNAHQRELNAFDQDWALLLSKVESLGGLYDEYSRGYSRLESDLGEAKRSADIDLQPLDQRRSEVERMKGRIEEMHTEISGRLRDMGAESAINPFFDGWEKAVIRSLYVEACQGRRIDPDKGPVITEMPQSPKPIKPLTDRTVQEKPFTVWDLPMLFGGLAFGSSTGAAIGGITFDSDGWHFSPIFWLLLGVATIAAFMVGKVLFHRLVAVMVIDSVDVYPYLSSDEVSIANKKKRARASMLSAAGIVSVFAVFCLTDFYGWWRAVTEQNAAYAGDAGSVVLNPVFAGVAVAFITVLMAGVKLASVTAAANQVKYILMDEVELNTVVFSDQCKRYDADMIEYNQLVAEAKEYQRLVKEAMANAEFRFRRETKSLRHMIEAYLACVEQNDPQEIVTIEAQMNKIVDLAMETVKPQQNAVEEVEKTIDGIYSDLDRLRNIDLGPEPIMGGEGPDEISKALVWPLSPSEGPSEKPKE